MKKLIPGLLLVIFFFTGCDTFEAEKPTGAELLVAPLHEVIEAAWDGVVNLFDEEGELQALNVGDQVVTNKDADLYDRPNGAVIDTVPEGTTGTVDRSKTGWASVGFDNGQSGIVREEDIDTIIDPPPPPPTGDGLVLGGASCSMGRDTFWGIAGGFASSEHTAWPKTDDNGTKITKSWSGGGLNVWGGGPGTSGYSIKWNSFENGIAAYPPDVLLFMICVGSLPQHDTVTDEYLDYVRHVEEQFQARWPEVDIYITGTPRYSGGHQCTSPPDFAHEIAMEGAAVTDFQYVDLNIVLDPSWLKDACHIGSSAGYTHAGEQLDAWLDTL